jgi:glutathione S-transferase
MAGIRDVYDQAVAHHVVMNERQRSFGLPRLEDANLSMLERTLEVEVRVGHIVRSACAGDRVTAADCFAAMAHLAALAAVLEDGERAGVGAGEAHG